MSGKMVRMALGVTVALAFAMAGSTPAMAGGGGGGGGGGGVIRSGSCSGSSDWKLKVKPDNSSIEVELEVDSNVIGQAWQVRITQNRTRIFAGTRVTSGPSGSFDVGKMTSNSAGTDRFRAQAVNGATGEVCVGTASL